MKASKILAFILILAMLSSMAFAINVAAEDTETDEPAAEEATATDTPSVIEPMPMPTVPVLPRGTGCIKGEITKVVDCFLEYGDDQTPLYIGAYGEAAVGTFILTVSVGKDEVYTVFVDQNTFILNLDAGEKPAEDEADDADEDPAEDPEEAEAAVFNVGDSVRVYYDMKAPMLMIYPPQIVASMVALNLDDAVSIEIDRFDKDFIDSKNSLKLNISEDTAIIYQNGDVFDGKTEELIGRNLVVVYAITTRSIPAQTAPELIVVLYEKISAPIYRLGDEEKAVIAAAFAEAEIVINGAVLDAPGPFMNEEGVLMVPVRAISEALGFDVEWFGDTQTVVIGKLLSFTIGKDGYSFAKMAPIPLGLSAPVLVNDRTYVPINLFEFAGQVGIGNVDYYYASGQIIITVSVDEPEETGEDAPTE